MAGAACSIDLTSKLVRRRGWLGRAGSRDVVKFTLGPTSYA